MSHNIPTNSAGAAHAAEHIVPSSHTGNTTSGADHQSNAAATGGVQQHLLGQHHTSAAGTKGAAQQDIPGQHHTSSTGTTGNAQQHIAGQHHTSSGDAQQHIPGQHHPSSTTTAAGAGAATGGAAASAHHIHPTTHANPATGHTSQNNEPIDNPQNNAPAHPKKAGDIPGVLEGPVHKSKLLNELDPRVKAHPGSATTGGHHTIPKIGETHHQHGWKE